MTYAMQLTTATHVIQATGDGQPINGGVAGRPIEIIVNQLPAGATIYLSGTVNGTQVFVPLTVIDGQIEISREMLNQFTVEGRYGVQVQGVANGQQVSLTVTSEQMFLYDTGGPLDSEAASQTVNANGVGVLAVLHGRVEAFDVESVTPQGANANYLLFINPALGPQSVNITNMPNTVITTSGIMVTGSVENPRTPTA